MPNNMNDSEINMHLEKRSLKSFFKALVEELLKKYYRYHFAFIDPFGPSALKFETLTELAKLDRMDMLIHFPIGPIKRTIKKWIKGKNTILDNFMGTSEWRCKVNVNRIE